MKKRYFLFATFLVLCSVKAQVVSIPNANFKNKLLSASPSNYIAQNLSGQYFKIDANNDSEIQQSEALQVSTLDVSISNISSLIGIAYFTNLTALNCSSNQLSTLGVSTLTNLTYLNCAGNQLANLNVNTLTNLEYLGCSSNQLTILNVNGATNLTYLYCGTNQLTSLQVNSLIHLIYIDCNGNQLTTLQVNTLTNLNTLYCGGNQLSVLNVNGLTNLVNLNCTLNQLTSLELNNTVILQFLNCAGNQLTSLNVNDAINISNLYCENNNLVSLYIKNGRNEGLAGGTLEFSNNPNLHYICADEGQLTDVQNKITQYGYTNCYVNSYCSFTPGGTFYTIQGSNKYDSNINGCDAFDSSYPNLKLSFSDGTNTGNLISDTSGNYFFSVSSGTHTITPILENPSYFTISPSAATVTFPATASPFIQNFCITPNGSHNDLEVLILPTTVARPGFDATYKIIYKNKGNTTQSGSLNLNFNDSVLDFVSANPIASSQTLSNLSWNFTTLAPFETRQIMVVLNVNSTIETPAVNSGDVLHYVASITNTSDETPTDNTANLNQTVVNALDPNDKTCLEGITISPSMIGEYVHYMIRFENTGAFSAQNIVVRDIIDTAKFDIATLTPTNGSHNYYTRISNPDKVEFIFENINLPFDDAHNDGYVSFKIKTKSNLVVGNTISNLANIYFDYNAPITTNTATTTIQTLNNLDNDLSDFTFSPNPAKDFIEIKTNQNIEITSVTIYNTIGQLVQIVTSPTNRIDISTLKSGNYIMTITSDKGNVSRKFMKE